MAENVKITVEERRDSGTRASRKLRRGGKFPAVINLASGGSAAIVMNRHDFEMTMKRHGRDNLLVDMEIKGAKPIKTLLKEVQYDSVCGVVLHADFVEISMTRKIRVQIPVRLAGDPAGVTEQEGVLEHMLRELAVECLPGDIVNEIVADVSALRIGDVLHVKDLKVGDKMTVISAADMPVASVHAQAAEPVEEVAAVVAEGEQPTEPELIGRKKDEEEEGEAAEGAEAPAGKEKAPAGKEKAAVAGKDKAAPAATGKDKAAPAAAGKEKAAGGAKEKK